MITVVDGNNILHSSYHTAKFRAESDEQFIKSFLIRFESFKRKYQNLHLVFDGKDNTAEQSQLIDTYKEGRVKDKKQIKLFLRTIYLLKALGYSVYHEDGVEADQVIAHLALTAKEQGDSALIISTDKDFNQLICKQIKVYDPRAKVLRDNGHVVAKYGIKPSQFAFYLTLAGDTIDGVPGLKGCGPANAVKLIQKHKTFKNAYNTLRNTSFALDRYDKLLNEQLEFVKSCYQVVKLKKLSIEPRMILRKRNDIKIKAYCEAKGLSYAYLFGARKF
jgi:DNA polymerase-1